MIDPDLNQAVEIITHGLGLKVVGAERILGVDGGGDGIRIEFEGRPGGGIYKVVHNESEATMKQFAVQKDAIAHAKTGAQALFVYDENSRGLIYDLDLERLETTAIDAGMKEGNIEIINDGRSNRCVSVDDSGVLEKLIKVSG